MTLASEKKLRENKRLANCPTFHNTRGMNRGRMASMSFKSKKSRHGGGSSGMGLATAQRSRKWAQSDDCQPLQGPWPTPPRKSVLWRKTLSAISVRNWTCKRCFHRWERLTI